MKNLITVSFFFLFISQTIFTQWFWQNPLPQGNDLYDVCFTDENTGIAVGDFGAVLRTTNGGEDWYTMRSTTAREILIGVSFCDALNGIAVGTLDSMGINFPLAIRTNDGGVTWTKLTNGLTGVLNDVSFIDENLCIAVGSGGTILRTTNGGITWIQQTSGTIHTLVGVCFIDQNTGTAVGYNGTILRTTDGGVNWVQQNSGTTDLLYSVSFTDANIGTTVGGLTILRTTDGGTSWIPQVNPEPLGLKSVFFTDTYNGTAVGGFIIITTTDGGNTWIGQPTSSSLWGVTFASTSSGTAIGTGGVILKTTDGGQNWINQTGITDAFLYGVSFTDSSTGTAVGSGGTILRTTDGGINWTEQASGIGTLYGVYFSDINNGVAVGGGKILRTTDGGENWVPYNIVPYVVLRSVFFIDENTGSVVGEGGTILRTIDGGETWTPQTSGTTEDLYGVSLIDANNAIVVGNNGIILKTTDGGTIWTQQVSGTTNALNDISIIDANIAIAVGINSTVIKTTDGGVTWISQITGIDLYCYGVYFTDANNGTIIGSGPLGVIIKTTDGGTTWSLQKQVSQGLRSVSFTDQNNGTAVGIRGTILRTYNGGGLIPFIEVNYPNGGEYWINGTTEAIAWSGENVDDVKIELSIDNGVNWSTIVDSIPNTGLYTWTVNTPYYSEECLIRVSDLAYPIYYDVSDSVFTIDIITEENNLNCNLPEEFGLFQNYPNPFNPNTTINYALPHSCDVTITLYDILGNEVSTLVSENEKAGYYSVEFNASNLPSGIYFYRIKAGEFVSIKKMVLLK